MAYQIVLNAAGSISRGDAVALARELDDLRSELNDIRTKYAALLAKMDTDFADVANASVDYAASCSLAAATFTAT